MQNESQRHNDKGREKTSLQKYVPLTLFVTFACERELEDEQNCNILTPHSYGRQRCVFLVLQGCSTGGPETHSVGWWLSLLHLISNFSGPQLIGAPRAPSAWRGFPYHILSATFSNSNCQTSVLTELYNSSTPTQSPTRSLEWHVWSSSSENNCHAVHRSLSSGVSLRSGTVGPSPCPILSALIRPRDLFRLLAIGMCHFLPVHHLEMACLADRRSKYNSKALCIVISFLVFWFICGNSFLVYFKNDPKYIKLRTTHCIYPFDEISSMLFSFE